MEAFLQNIDLLNAWLANHPIIAGVLGAVALGIADRVVKATPWQGDDCLLDIVERALKGESKGGGNG